MRRLWVNKFCRGDAILLKIDMLKESSMEDMAPKRSSLIAKHIQRKLSAIPYSSSPSTLTIFWSMVDLHNKTLDLFKRKVARPNVWSFSQNLSSLCFVSGLTVYIIRKSLIHNVQNFESSCTGWWRIYIKRAGMNMPLSKVLNSEVLHAGNWKLRGNRREVQVYRSVENRILSMLISLESLPGHTSPIPLELKNFVIKIWVCIYHYCRKFVVAIHEWVEKLPIQETWFQIKAPDRGCQNVSP